MKTFRRETRATGTRPLAQRPGETRGPDLQKHVGICTVDGIYCRRRIEQMTDARATVFRFVTTIRNHDRNNHTTTVTIIILHNTILLSHALATIARERVKICVFIKGLGGVDWRVCIRIRTE